MSYRQKLGKSTTWRNRLIRNQLSDLIIHEKLVLEVERAKQLKREFDKLMTTAKKQTLAARRDLDARLYSRVTKDKKTAAQKLYQDLVKRYPDRNSGYTRVVRLGRRKGDNAEDSINFFSLNLERDKINKSVIEVNNLSFTYPGQDKPALKDISFTINENEYVCIVGHNGSGKSTLAKLLAAILYPSNGTIKIKNLLLTKRRAGNCN